MSGTAAARIDVATSLTCCLPAPLRPHRMDLDFMIRNGNVGGDVEHFDYVDRAETSHSLTR